MTNSFDQRLEQEKLAAMKELAYGASHEINNPLANIAARAQTLLRDEQQPDRRRALESIHQQAMRAHEMISDLMLFARPPALDRRPVDLVALLHEVSAKFSRLCEPRNIRVATKFCSDEFVIPADAQQLTVALTAVCTNAMEAIGTDGAIEIALRTSSEPAAMAIIDVTDSGPGISDDVRRHLFDPFFSGREAGRGLGFGLSKCWRIVKDHGGSVVVDSTPGEGATLTLHLPTSSPPS